MATITLGSSSYSTYRSLAQTDAYLAADFGADAYIAGDTTARSRSVVTGTRTLDRMAWLGDKAESDQPNAWPRINTGVSGVIDDEVPDDILNAESELAKFIAAGTDVLNPDQSENIKREAAGSVSLEFFRNLEDATRLPIAVQELISRYLGGGAYSLVQAFGTDECSEAPHYKPARSF